MPRSLSWPPGRHWLQSQVARLCQSLARLKQRLGDELAQTVAQAVAQAVREVVHRSLEVSQPEHEDRRAIPRRSTSLWNAGEPPWDEQDRLDDEDERFDLLDDDAEETPLPQTKVATLSTRVSAALSIGCQAVALGLRRQASLVKAVGVGVIAAVTAYVAGPVVVVASTTLLSLLCVAQPVPASGTLLPPLS
jgi:hypothetical protein